MKNLIKTHTKRVWNASLVYPISVRQHSRNVETKSQPEEHTTFFYTSFNINCALWYVFVYITSCDRFAFYNQSSFFNASIRAITAIHDTRVVNNLYWTLAFNAIFQQSTRCNRFRFFKLSVNDAIGKIT